jgi:hypothetical protein
VDDPEFAAAVEISEDEDGEPVVVVTDRRGDVVTVHLRGWPPPPEPAVEPGEPLPPGWEPESLRV